MILVTNNPMVQHQWKGNTEISIEMKPLTPAMDVFYAARDFVHRGHSLLTHPFIGSLKPNENPYKSVLVSNRAKQLNVEHVATIEQCIQVALQALDNKPLPSYSEKILVDYRLIEADLISNAIKSALGSSALRVR